MKRIVWIILGCLTLGSTAQAASFDCSKAKSRIEKMICSNSELSKLDEELNTAYRRGMSDKYSATNSNNPFDQEEWIKARNRCPDVDCVRIEYEMRIYRLKSKPVINDPNIGIKIKPNMDENNLTWNYDLVGHYSSKEVSAFSVNEARQLAFVLVDSTAIAILDISSVSEIKLISKIDLASKNVLPSQVISNHDGTMLYVVANCNTNGLCTSGVQIVDIHDPSHPSLARSYDDFTEIRQIALSQDGHKLFVLDQSKNEIDIIDSDVVNKTKVLGRLKIEMRESLKDFINSFSLSPSGNIIYFWVVDDGLFIADISDPTSIQILGRVNPWGYADTIPVGQSRTTQWLGDFVVSENDETAFFNSAMNDSFFEYDFSHPKSPEFLANLFDLGVSMRGGGTIKMRIFDENTKLIIPFSEALWFHGEGGGLALLDISSTGSPELLGIINVPISHLSSYYSSDNGNYIFVSSNDVSKKGQINSGVFQIFSRQ